MKFPPRIFGANGTAVLRVDPTFTTEETIVLRALVAGKTDKQVCSDLRMPLNLYRRLIRDLREKTGTVSNVSLVVWAQRRMKSGDQRLNRRDRYERPGWSLEGIASTRS
jgi:DNA-binding CsgD family transcriptional regulator